MTEYRYHPEAIEEYKESVLHYKGISSAVAENFVSSVEHAVQIILEHPQLWMIVSKNIRRCVVKKFPYNILYTEAHGAIIILAIAHQKRKPNYWKRRKI